MVIVRLLGSHIVLEILAKLVRRLFGVLVFLQLLLQNSPVKQVQESVWNVIQMVIAQEQGHLIVLAAVQILARHVQQVFVAIAFQQQLPRNSPV